MIQCGYGSGFEFEASQAILIRGQRAGQDFYGYVALQARIAGAIDFAHAAGADERLNFVRAEFGSRRKRH